MVDPYASTLLTNGRPMGDAWAAVAATIATIAAAAAAAVAAAPPAPPATAPPAPPALPLRCSFYPLSSFAHLSSVVALLLRLV